VIVSGLALALALFGLKKWSRITGYVLRLFRAKKNETAAAAVVTKTAALASSASLPVLAPRCPAPDVLNALLKQCPLLGSPGELVANVTAVAKPASSSSLTTAAVLVCVGSVGLVVAATLGTRGFRFALAVCVLLLALGAVLPL
jgi:hypothetical protein